MTRRGRDLRELVESAGREFAADDAERKANEARRRGDAPIRVDRTVGGSRTDRVIPRLQGLADLLFGRGPIPVVGVLVVLVLLWLAIVALGSRDSAPADAGGGAAPLAETTTDEGAADSTGAVGAELPVGTYQGVVTGDIGEYGRVFQTDSTETSRADLANAVSITVHEDGRVTGSLRWDGEQHSASDWCTTVRIHEESGEFDGTADTDGRIEGNVTLSGSGTQQSTCDGAASDPVTHDNPPAPYPFTASVVDGHLTGEITGIFTFAADNRGSPAPEDS